MNEIQFNMTVYFQLRTFDHKLLPYKFSSFDDWSTCDTLGASWIMHLEVSRRKGPAFDAPLNAYLIAYAIFNIFLENVDLSFGL